MTASTTTLRAAVHAFVRVQAATRGRTLARAGGPLFVVLGVVGAVAFGPHGMRPADLTTLAATSLAARATLWALWLALATPLAAAVLADRSGDFLRSLPVPRAWHVAALAALLLGVQAPWALLWGAGAGWLAACTAATLATGLEASLLARPRGWPGRLSLVALVASLVLAPSTLVVLPVALAATWVALVAAWSRPPERASGAGIRPPSRFRSGAIARLWIVALRRGERTFLSRAVLLALAGGLVHALYVRNNGPLPPSRVAVSAWAIGLVPLVLVSAGLASRLRKLEQQAGWWWRWLAVGGRVRAVAAAGVSALGGGVAGLLSVVPLAVLHATGTRTLARVAAGGGAWGVAVGLLVLALYRRAAMSDEDGPPVLPLLGVVAGGWTLVALLGGGAIAVVAGAALFLAWSGAAPDRPAGGRISSKEGCTMGALLEVTGVARRRGGRVVLAGCDLRCARPGVLVLQGDNGAGKSTLLGIVSGQLEPDAGRVCIDGHDLRTERVAALRALGHAPDVPDLPAAATAGEIVSLVATLKRCAVDRELVARLGVTAYADLPCGALSLGQWRRLGLLLACLGRPRVLALDEPGNGLDAEGLALLEALLREHTARGGAALVATHDRALAARVADARAVLSEGRVRGEGDGGPAGC